MACLYIFDVSRCVGDVEISEVQILEDPENDLVVKFCCEEEDNLQCPYA